MSQQHASVSQHGSALHAATLETELADQTFHLTQSQYTDTRPTSPSADPIMPGAWQGSYWSANFSVTGMIRPGKIPMQAGFEPQIFCSHGRCLNHQANDVVTKVPIFKTLVWFSWDPPPSLPPPPQSHPLEKAWFNSMSGALQADALLLSPQGGRQGQLGTKVPYK